MVSTKLSSADNWGTVKARLGVNRMHYAVAPGLYAVGEPSPESPVFVSANYKMSFDYLRRSLDGIDGWILVIDTKGINVWCAAGKGTFGTDEIVTRIATTGLDEVVTHRELIVPQLGAPGVSAHEVKKRSGFKVIYGPVRCEDIPAFLEAGKKATDEMRRVRFPLVDRLVLVPMEFVPALKWLLIPFVPIMLAFGFRGSGYSIDRWAEGAVASLILVGTGLVCGAVLTPLLLPWLPGKSFSVKGGVLGALGIVLVLVLDWTKEEPGGFAAGPIMYVLLAACVLLVAAMSSFLAMNFTGASTYTSLSGVVKEMRWAIPAQILAGLAGLGLLIAGLIVG